MFSTFVVVTGLLVPVDISTSLASTPNHWISNKRLPARLFATSSSSIDLIPCLHGEGLIGKMMAHGYGFHIQLPGQPSIYVTGDTILTETIKEFVTRAQPSATALPAGGANFDIGGEIIMRLSEAIHIGELAKGLVIANHLEALDHCPVTRKSIQLEVKARGWQDRFFVPDDGESISFK